METAGEHLRAELRRLGISQARLSTSLEVTRQTINNIINGRQEISRSIARKLGPITGHAADYWLRDSFIPSNRQSSSLAPLKPPKTGRAKRVPIQ